MLPIQLRREIPTNSQSHSEKKRFRACLKSKENIGIMEEKKNILSPYLKFPMFFLHNSSIPNKLLSLIWIIGKT
jgi:hypothetical protein